MSISFVFVEAGRARSTTLDVSISSFFVLFRDISGSEQIHIALIGSFASADHSLRVCPRSAIEGTRKSITHFPPVSFSAILREVNVFPVPHAIISFPLSLILKYSCVFSSASI